MGLVWHGGGGMSKGKTGKRPDFKSQKESEILSGGSGKMRKR
jgi:hypothetical protein